MDKGSKGSTIPLSAMGFTICRSLVLLLRVNCALSPFARLILLEVPVTDGDRRDFLNFMSCARSPRARTGSPRPSLTLLASLSARSSSVTTACGFPKAAKTHQSSAHQFSICVTQSCHISHILSSAEESIDAICVCIRQIMSTFLGSSKWKQFS